MNEWWMNGWNPSIHPSDGWMDGWMIDFTAWRFETRLNLSFIFDVGVYGATPTVSERWKAEEPVTKKRWPPSPVWKRVWSSTPTPEWSMNTTVLLHPQKGGKRAMCMWVQLSWNPTERWGLCSPVGPPTQRSPDSPDRPGPGSCPPGSGRTCRGAARWAGRPPGPDRWPGHIEPPPPRSGRCWTASGCRPLTPAPCVWDTKMTSDPADNRHQK